jgi:hypothetical protein
MLRILMPVFLGAAAGAAQPQLDETLTISASGPG